MLELYASLAIDMDKLIIIILPLRSAAFILSTLRRKASYL